MAIGANSPGPVVFLENSGVNVQTEGKMVVDEVFSRGSDIHGVEVGEMMLEDVGLLLRHWRTLRIGRFAVEDVRPDLIGHVFGSDTQRSNFTAIDVTCIY